MGDWVDLRKNAEKTERSRQKKYFKVSCRVGAQKNHQRMRRYAILALEGHDS